MSSAGDRLIMAKLRAEQKIDADMRGQLGGVLNLLDPYDLDMSYPTFEAAFLQVVHHSSSRFLTVEQAFLKAYCAAEFGMDVAVAKPAAELIGWEARDRIASSVRTVTAASIKAQTAQAISIEKSAAGARKRAVEVASRHARGPARSMATETARQDSRLGYFKRVATGNENCSFCRALQARGAVYDAESAKFAAHDGCDCVAVPARGGKEVPVEAYTPSARKGTATDADKERFKVWLEENK